MESTSNINKLSTEEHFELAVKTIINSGKKSNGDFVMSIRHAASTFQVDRSTLGRRLQGGKSRVDAHAMEKKLSTAAESVLVAWIKVMGQRGVPITPSMVTEYASELAGKPVIYYVHIT